MLSGLVVFGAITALVAGIAGAWSPCGFSMVDTIGTALGDARRGITIVAAATFTIGALAGGAITFGGLSLVGQLLGHGSSAVRDALAGALALAAAFADWRGWRIAPQIRRQVPERWRWIMPLPLASALYGVLLGLGFTTFVLSFAVWALAGISVAAASTTFGVATGLAFGIGRALPVLWIAPRLGTAAGDRALEQLALEPRLWLGMRRLDALGLGVCAALLGSSSALAAPIASATDPSVDGSIFAWQQVGGPGMLRILASTQPLKGTLPAVGAGNMAWLGPRHIVIARGVSSGRLQRIRLPRHGTVDALAISGEWLVVRDGRHTGGENLFAVSLADHHVRRNLARSSTPGAIGRPAIEVSRVVFGYSTRAGSWLYAVDLDSGVRRILRHASRNVEYANPALADGRLLYERTDRCAQTLLLGSQSTARHDRVLVTLPSTVLRDPGYEADHIRDYNAASLCANRGIGPGSSTTLGATALGATAAYVSESPTDLARTRIVRIPLG